MDNKKNLKYLFESIPDYTKKVFLKFLIENDATLLHDFGFLKNDVNNIKREYKNTLKEHNEDYFDYKKNFDWLNGKKFLKIAWRS